MGALQSKIWSEVPSNEVPESPSETQPLSTHGKPVAPFRDPRSISDDVERTPIQLGSDKSKETARSNSIPEVNQTPTGPSFAARFKDASIDPRSPGGQGLTRTPIILKEDFVEEKCCSKTDKAKEKESSTKPIRGSAAFVEKLQETSEIEDLLKSTSKMEISTENEVAATESKTPSEEVNQTENENDENIETTESCNEGKENTVSGISIDKETDGTLSTPSSNRCGKKTMFPMVIGYEEAKSPRSPLGQLNLNTKFMASPVNSNSKSLSGSGDGSNNAIQAQVPIPKISLGENMEEVDQENQNDTNRSLVI